MLNRHGEWSLVFHRGTSDRLGQGTISDAMFGRRCMTHGKAARRDARSGDDIEIVLRLKVTDFELSKADNTERRVFTRPIPITPCTPCPSVIATSLLLNARFGGYPAFVAAELAVHRGNNTSR